MPSVEEAIQEWWGNQPHPQAPTLKVSEYPVAMRLATILKFGGGHASPQEASNFWREYQHMNQSLAAQKKLPVGPEEFTHLAQQMGRSSFAYHGRPPSMYEIGRLREADPKTIHDYFGALPDEHYPTVSAAEMAKAMHAAAPWAQQYIGREPNKLEAAYLVHSGQNPSEYYKSLSYGDANRLRGDTGVSSPEDAGGQPSQSRTADPRLAQGSAPAGGPTGLSARGAGGTADS